MDDESLDNKEMLKPAENFENVYESNVKSIYKFLYWRTGDVHLSEDLTSSVFEKAWTYRNKFTGGSIKAWLYLIARNTLIDNWRKKQMLYVEDPESLVDRGMPAASEVLDKELQLQELGKALKKLPKNMYDVVELRFIEQLSCKQVAAKLKISESNVRVIQYRALIKLRDLMK